ncbi:hypothetical protein ES332_A01G200200v1 [Gossypium tomentosum]|uniref:TTF-type domain-containing protein n=1 Tax=Gossypium tomentosum TaxID=34277 RepID=A0A5D2RVF6_GOSTO|nr:hypothetical protein ES332_A01G200200v1 [Gossypium tomentosum]
MKKYSPTKDAIYCFSCYLFSKHIVRHGTDAFTMKGFNNWKKVNDGKMCAFLNHVGQYPSSPHNNVEKSCQDLLNQSWHIDKNRGNFLEFITLLAFYNDKVFLDNAPRNAKYTSHMIQKEKMTIVLRYVDEKRFIKERLFDLVHVQDITAMNLKEEICIVLSWHCLDVICVHNFFSNLNFIVNIISASCKLHDLLQVAQVIEIANMLEINELETVKEIMGIIDIIYDWDNLLEVVKAFCEKRNIKVLDMDSPYVIKCAIKLLILSSALDHKDAYKSFNMESAFSAMKIIKTRLRNQMEDEFLTNNLIYIEREIVETFESDSIISDFVFFEKSRAQF